jgi:hypothetical protein
VVIISLHKRSPKSGRRGEPVKFYKEGIVLKQKINLARALAISLAIILT